MEKDGLHGGFSSWEKMLDNLPVMTPTQLDIKNSVTALRDPELTEGETRRLNNILGQLKPWRKGPFSLYGVEIDTEWRSDWKWDRVPTTYFPH